MKRVARFGALTLVILVALAGSAFAQTTVTTTGANGNWSNAGIWSPSVVPNNGGGNTYAVQILNTPVAPTVTLDTNINVNSLGIQSGAGLSTLSGTTLTLGTLDNSGTLVIGSGGTVNLTGGLGITDIVATASFDVVGSFTLGSPSTSALSNLTTVEGSLTLRNGQTTLVMPGGSPATLTLAMGGMADVENGSTLSISGNLVNDGMLTLGTSGGGGIPSDTLNVTGMLTNNGSLVLGDFSGDVANAGSLVNTGSIYIGQNTTLNLTGGGAGITDVVAGSSLDVAGSLLVTNGGTTTNGLAHLTAVEGMLTLENGATTSATPMGGTLNVGMGAALDVSGTGTRLDVHGALSNTGSVAVMGSGNALNVTGNFNNSGAVEIGQSNLLNVSNTYKQGAGLTDVVGTLSAQGVKITGGTLQGTGLITGNLFVTGGTLMPGETGHPGTLTLSGNYLQGPGGTLVIDISGTPAGQYSVFSVSGSAQLAGAVDFVALNGFAPVIGDEFTFLYFGAASGDFANMVFTNWACPAGAVCEDLFGNGTLTLEILPTPPPPTQTPEPGSLLLLGCGLAACCGYLRKRKNS